MSEGIAWTLKYSLKYIHLLINFAMIHGIKMTVMYSFILQKFDTFLKLQTYKQGVKQHEKRHFTLLYSQIIFTVS